MNAGADEVRYLRVRVTNGTDKSWSDMYDGVPITIAPGETETMPLDMAAHFFGWHPGINNAHMFNHIVRRRGMPVTDRLGSEAFDQKANEFFAKFVVEPVTYKLVEEQPADRRKPVPADRDDGHPTPDMKEPTSIKDVITKGMVHPDEEPKTPEYRGRGRPPADTLGGRRREGE